MLIRSHIFRSLSQFVPRHSPADTHDRKNFKQFLTHYENILVLTGAGVSTESGIPDYRSEDVGMFSRKNYRPIQYSDFVNNPESRRRYWARNFVAWPRFSSFSPSRVHWYISSLEKIRNKMIGLVTQNVDGLHSKAGSQNVIELHGNAFWVRCLNCGDTVSRFDFQKELQKCNPFMKSSGEIRPDGDVELDEDDVKNFQAINCAKCGGILKPTIVFFGENVPESRVNKVKNLVEASDALLVLGTSLSTLSSKRIVEQAFDLCKFICIVNIGLTECDKMADLKISANVNDIIPKTEESPSDLFEKYFTL